MNRNELILLGAVVALTFAGPGRADTVEVEANGSIQAAVDAAVSGDTILIRRGTYSENVTLSGRTDLTIVARGATLRSADGADAALTIERCDGIRVMGLRIDAGSGGGVDVVDSDDVTISRNRITVDAGVGIEAHGCTRLRIARNVLATTGASAIDVEADAGSRGAGAVIVRNRVVRSGGDGIVVSGVAALVRRNRVTHCGDDGIVAAAVGVHVVANVVVGTGDDGIVVDGSEGAVRANVVRQAAGLAIAIDGTAIVAVGNRPDDAAPAILDEPQKYDDGGMVVCPDGGVAPGACPPTSGE